MPTHQVFDQTELAERPAVALTAASYWRAVAGLAVVAGVWSSWQLVSAVQSGGIESLLPAAFVIYGAGLGYLAAVAIAAARFSRSLRGGQAIWHSPLLWFAHTFVIAAALATAWRGVDARGMLVGLGVSLAAWAVVALLALAGEAISWQVRHGLSRAGRSPGVRFQGAVSPATASLLCVVVLLLGLGYLESQPLPNLPDKLHLPRHLGVDQGKRPVDNAAASEQPPGTPAGSNTPAQRAS